MTQVEVKTSTPYTVEIGHGLLASAGGRIRAVCGGTSAAVVSDDTVFSLYGAALCTQLEAAGYRVVPFVFPHGEQSKNLSTYAELVNFLAEKRLTRADVLVALGGGVTGDLGGFAAATYLRGIRYVQVPTTLLAAVDSSVGGKTAVDLPAGKNLAGCFHQPSLVLCDLDTLSTLPEETFRDGCAEVIKYGMIDSAGFLRQLSETPAREQLEHVVTTCVRMKRDVVSEDEFDRGRRQLLNFGHTFGHAVEACSRFAVSHGSAVAIGMAMASRAACARGLCGADVPETLLTLLRQYGLPTETDFSADMLYGALCADKKIEGTSIHLIVPDRLGHCRIEQAQLADVPAWLAAGGAR